MDLKSSKWILYSIVSVILFCSGLLVGSHFEKIFTETKTKVETCNKISDIYREVMTDVEQIPRPLKQKQGAIFGVLYVKSKMCS